MSDSAVLRLVQEMEGLLETPGSLRDPVLLEGWNRRFREAADSAERGPGWQAILGTAHEMARRVDRALGELNRQGRSLRADLEIQNRGERALRGYAAQRS